MGSETTPQMLAMADRIAEEVAYSGRHPQIELEHRRAALAAIKLTTELAATLAESDSLILSESRSGGSFGKTRKDHGELIATALRNGEHYHDR